MCSLTNFLETRGSAGTAAAWLAAARDAFQLAGGVDPDVVDFAAYEPLPRSTVMELLMLVAHALSALDRTAALVLADRLLDAYGESLMLLSHVAAAEIVDGREVTEPVWTEMRTELHDAMMAWVQEEAPKDTLLGGLDLVRDGLVSLVHVRGQLRVVVPGQA